MPIYSESLFSLPHLDTRFPNGFMESSYSWDGGDTLIGSPDSHWAPTDLLVKAIILRHSRGAPTDLFEKVVIFRHPDMGLLGI